MGDFHKAFEDIDEDMSGEITIEELNTYMKRMNYKPGFVEKWLNLFDADYSGTITYEEFCDTLGLKPREEVVIQLEEAKVRRESTAKSIVGGVEGAVAGAAGLETTVEKIQEEDVPAGESGFRVSDEIKTSIETHLEVATGVTTITHKDTTSIGAEITTEETTATEEKSTAGGQIGGGVCEMTIVETTSIKQETTLMDKDLVTDAQIGAQINVGPPGVGEMAIVETTSIEQETTLVDKDLVTGAQIGEGFGEMATIETTSTKQETTLHEKDSVTGAQIGKGVGEMAIVETTSIEHETTLTDKDLVTGAQIGEGFGEMATVETTSTKQDTTLHEKDSVTGAQIGGGVGEMAIVETTSIKQETTLKDKDLVTSAQIGGGVGEMAIVETTSTKQDTTLHEKDSVTGAQIGGGVGEMVTVETTSIEQETTLKDNDLVTGAQIGGGVGEMATVETTSTKQETTLHEKDLVTGAQIGGGVGETATVETTSIKQETTLKDRDSATGGQIGEGVDEMAIVETNFTKEETTLTDKDLVTGGEIGAEINVGLPGVGKMAIVETAFTKEEITLQEMDSVTGGQIGTGVGEMVNADINVLPPGENEITFDGANAHEADSTTSGQFAGYAYSSGAHEVSTDVTFVEKGTIDTKKETLVSTLFDEESERNEHKRGITEVTSDLTSFSKDETIIIEEGAPRIGEVNAQNNMPASGVSEIPIEIGVIECETTVGNQNGADMSTTFDGTLVREELSNTGGDFYDVNSTRHPDLTFMTEEKRENESKQEENTGGKFSPDISMRVPNVSEIPPEETTITVEETTVTYEKTVTGEINTQSIVSPSTIDWERNGDNQIDPQYSACPGSVSTDDSSPLLNVVTVSAEATRPLLGVGEVPVEEISVTGEYKYPSGENDAEFTSITIDETVVLRETDTNDHVGDKRSPSNAGVSEVAIGIPITNLERTVSKKPDSCWNHCSLL